MRPLTSAINEAVLTKMEDKIPDLIQDRWAYIVIQENLVSTASVEKFARLMKFSNKDNHKTANCKKMRPVICGYCHVKDCLSIFFCGMKEKKDSASTSSLSSKLSSNVLLKSMIV